MNIRNDRPKLREDMLKEVFSFFIEEDRAVHGAWHQFTNWAKGKNRLAIERELNDKNGMAFWQTTPTSQRGKGWTRY
jgi:hypothetical protein